MKTSIRRWGNSLAVRIPSPFAKEASLDQGSEVDLKVTEAGLLIAPAKQRTYRLRDLMAGVTRSNLHQAVSTEEPVGKEAL